MEISSNFALWLYLCAHLLTAFAGTCIGVNIGMWLHLRFCLKKGKVEEHFNRFVRALDAEAFIRLKSKRKD